MTGAPRDVCLTALIVYLLVFSNTPITGHDKAVYLDKIFETRNSAFHASTFAELDKTIDRAARNVEASLLLRQNILTSFHLLDKYYDGGRDMVIQIIFFNFGEVLDSFLFFSLPLLICQVNLHEQRPVKQGAPFVSITASKSSYRNLQVASCP